MSPDDSQKIDSNTLSIEESRQHIKEIEARLCASQERFRALVESTSDWIWETDANFVCIYSNPKIQDMLGYTPEGVLGHTLSDFILAKGTNFAEFRTARETGRPFHQIKLPCRHKTGRHIVLEISGIPIIARDGALQGWCGTAHNITDEEEARQLHALEDVINQNVAIVIVWGMEPNQWSVEFISENVTNILGYTSNDFLSGRVSWTSITHPDDNPRLEKEVYQHLEQGKRKWSQEYRLITKSKEIRWFHDNNLAFTDSAGRVTKIQAVVYDITERKNIEEERDLISREILQSQEGERKKFAGTIHDIAGSILVGISSSLRLVEEELKHGGVNSALVKVYQTKNLVKELVEMMKNVCADIWPPNIEIAGIPGALSELFSRFDSYSKIKTSHLVNLPDAWEKKHEGVGIVIYRLVQEALNNAMKYSEAKNLELIIDYDDNKVSLSIRDDGIGFETDKATIKKSSFGLKIMREQVESVGGNILIDSKPGCGTVIKAEFPPAPPPKNT